jgi:hypothetical protein
MVEGFPDKPKGMHWRTYDRLCRLHDAAEDRSIIGLMHFFWNSWVDESISPRPADGLFRTGNTEYFSFKNLTKIFGFSVVVIHAVEQPQTTPNRVVIVEIFGCQP